LFIGDWSEKHQLKGMISTPGISLRRKLSKHFPLYLVDEFRTSCLNYATEERGENLKIMFNGEIRKLHSVLTFTRENKRIGCINRDNNACRNIGKLVEAALEKADRPENFNRSNKHV